MKKYFHTGREAIKVQEACIFFHISINVHCIQFFHFIIFINVKI